MLKLFVDKALWKRVKLMALDHEETMTKIVNGAIEEYVKTRS
ncbi:MAG: hypothetical protein WBQ25_22745 [Nitrososphaeraceae archaeon]